jgi:hypothetical protein
LDSAVGFRRLGLGVQANNPSNHYVFGVSQTCYLDGVEINPGAKTTLGKCNLLAFTSQAAGNPKYSCLLQKIGLDPFDDGSYVFLEFDFVFTGSFSPSTRDFQMFETAMVELIGKVVEPTLSTVIVLDDPNL